MKNKFSGTLTAIITPFNNNGQVDLEALRFLVQRQHEAGVTGIVVLGTTGESPTIHHGREHIDTIEFCLSTARSLGKMKVIAGTGSNSTSEAVEMTKAARQIGVDGILSVEPYYNKPSHRGLLYHCEDVKEAAGDLPVIWYVIPGRSGNKIEDRTNKKIMEDGLAQGIKWASGDFDQLDFLVKNRPNFDFAIFSGDDKNTFPAMQKGACGVISVTSNVVPEEIVALTQRFLEGFEKTAFEIHKKLLPLMNTMFIPGEPNPHCVKTALSLIYPDEIKKVFRKPMCEMEPQNEAILAGVLRDYRLI